MAKGYSLGGNLPASNVANGLVAHVEDFINDDEKTILAVVEIGVNYSKKPRGSQELEPVLQIEYLEPITDPAAIAKLEALVGPIFTARTNENVRPKRGDKQDTPLDLSGLPDATSTDEAWDKAAKVTDIGGKKK